MKRLTTVLVLSIAIGAYAQNMDSSGPCSPDGEAAGYGYVDLGLPSGTLWAICNIGTDYPYEPGEYFAWGETYPRDLFKWNDYEFFESEYTDTDGTRTYSAIDIGRQISGTGYDAARSLWGDAWRIPAEEEWEELMEHCNAEYKEYALIQPKTGLLVTGPNGNSIILPLTFSPHGGFDTEYLRGEYWSATAATGENPYPSAVMMRFNPASSEMTLLPDGRHDGLSIRPVISARDISTAVSTLTGGAVTMRYEDLTLSAGGDTEGCRFDITDLSGRRVLDASAVNGALQLNALPKGIYIATLEKVGKIIGTLKISIK